MTKPEVFTDNLIDLAVERMRAGMQPATVVASLVAAATVICDQLAGADATRLMLEMAAQLHQPKENQR